MPKWSYKQALKKLKSLENVGVYLGLRRMQLLLDALGSPEQKFEAIHVVGTNGKTSTTRMTARLLQEHSWSVGAYYSPHLYGFCDRVEINGTTVAEADFAAAAQRVSTAAADVESLLDGERITQFEFLTALAFCEFARSGVRVAVVEAGLGGRLDATNVLDAPVVVLTNIALEHSKWLGGTLEEICSEKLAVLGPKSKLITGALEGNLEELAEGYAKRYKTQLKRLGREIKVSDEGSELAIRIGERLYDQIELKALGDFQRQNFALAVAAASSYLDGLDPNLVRQVASKLEVPGRMQIVEKEPLTLFDGAHNPAAVQALAGSLPRVIGDRPLVVIVSVLEEKDVDSIIANLVPFCSDLVCTQSSDPRAVASDRLAAICHRHLSGSVRVLSSPDPHSARALAEKLAGPQGAILVTGSLYLIADLVSKEEGRIRRIIATA